MDLNQILTENCHVTCDHLAVLEVQGPDAKNFLQGQLSCDLNKVTAKQWQWGIYANLQGRAVCLFLLFTWQDKYYLILSADLAEKVLAILSKYSVFSKVDITHLTTTLTGFIRQPHPLFQIANDHEVQATEHAVCLAFPGPTKRYLVMGEIPPVESPLVDATVWRYSDILAGIANITAATSEKFLPHRINYHLIGALDFKKGCYLGQEVIARMHYRSEIKHHAQIVTLKQEVMPGDTLFDPETQNKVAQVIDCVKENEETWLALISIADNHPTQLKSQTSEPFHINIKNLPYELTP